MAYPDGRELDYGYDARGERTSLTAKVGGTTLTTTTTYDAAGHVQGVKDPLGRSYGFTYDAAGRRTQGTSPNNTSTSYAYDARNALTSIATTLPGVAGATPTPIQSFAYTLDAAGRRTRVAEGDGTTRAYGYDSIDRLVSETVTGALSYGKTFTYDPVGNRLTQITTGAGAASVNHTYDPRDRLIAENAIAYVYDANGNVTSKSGEATYAWDFESRLTSVAMTGGSTVSHAYDADGNRVKTSVAPGAVTNMLVDPSGGLSQVVAETDGAGALTALYVRAGDELLAVIRPAAGGTWTTRYIHHDALGSVRVLTDEAGLVAATRGYEAFGTMNVEAGSDPLPYRFAGEAFEATSNFAYHRARWMDSRAGRFASMDPSLADVDTDGPDRPVYRYASANPVNRVDPGGLFDAGAMDLFAGFSGVAAAPSFTQAVAGAASAATLGTLLPTCNGQPCPGGVLADEMQRALFYLALSARGRQLEAAIKGGRMLKVKQVVVFGGPGRNQFDGVDTITWDPFAAMLVKNYQGINRVTSQSPALGLAHELAHSLGIVDPGVVTGWETIIAKQLTELGFHEDVRKNYFDAPGYGKVAHSDMTLGGGIPFGSTP
jgi:RHS repeat-associated protein